MIQHQDLTFSNFLHNVLVETICVPLEFCLVTNTLKEHRWFFNMQLLIKHGYLPTIMPEASDFCGLF